MLEYDPNSNASLAGMADRGLGYVFSGFVSVLDCRPSVLYTHLVSHTGRANDSLYCMHFVNSHHIVKIAGWRPWFFPRGFST